jgi:hypothetical protein
MGGRMSIILIQLNARREQALEDSDANLAALLYRLEEHVVIATEALEKIAGQDFRGNRPMECVIAYNALQKIKQIT